MITNGRTKTLVIVTQASCLTNLGNNYKPEAYVTDIKLLQFHRLAVILSNNPRYQSDIWLESTKQLKMNSLGMYRKFRLNRFQVQV